MDPIPLAASVPVDLAALLGPSPASKESQLRAILLSMVGQEFDVLFEATVPEGVKLRLPQGQVLVAQGNLPYPEGTTLRVQVLPPAPGEAAPRLQPLAAQVPSTPPVLAPLVQGEAYSLLQRLQAPDPPLQLRALATLFAHLDALAPSPQPAPQPPKPEAGLKPIPEVPTPLREPLAKALLQLLPPEFPESLVARWITREKALATPTELDRVPKTATLPVPASPQPPALLQDPTLPPRIREVLATLLAAGDAPTALPPELRANLAEALTLRLPPPPLDALIRQWVAQASPDPAPKAHTSAPSSAEPRVDLSRKARDNPPPAAKDSFSIWLEKIPGPVREALLPLLREIASRVAPATSGLAQPAPARLEGRLAALPIPEFQTGVRSLGLPPEVAPPEVALTRQALQGERLPTPQPPPSGLPEPPSRPFQPSPEPKSPWLAQVPTAVRDTLLPLLRELATLPAPPPPALAKLEAVLVALPVHEFQALVRSLGLPVGLPPAEVAQVFLSLNQELPSVPKPDASGQLETPPFSPPREPLASWLTQVPMAVRESLLPLLREVAALPAPTTAPANPIPQTLESVLAALPPAEFQAVARGLGLPAGASPAEVLRTLLAPKGDLPLAPDRENHRGPVLPAKPLPDSATPLDAWLNTVPQDLQATLQPLLKELATRIATTATSPALGTSLPLLARVEAALVALPPQQLQAMVQSLGLSGNLPPAEVAQTLVALVRDLPAPVPAAPGSPFERPAQLPSLSKEPQPFELSKVSTDVRSALMPLLRELAILPPPTPVATSPGAPPALPFSPLEAALAALSPVEHETLARSLGLPPGRPLAEVAQALRSPAPALPALANLEAEVLQKFLVDARPRDDKSTFPRTHLQPLERQLSTWSDGLRLELSQALAQALPPASLPPLLQAPAIPPAPRDLAEALVRWIQNLEPTAALPWTPAASELAAPPSRPFLKLTAFELPPEAEQLLNLPALPASLKETARTWLKALFATATPSEPQVKAPTPSRAQGVPSLQDLPLNPVAKAGLEARLALAAPDTLSHSEPWGGWVEASLRTLSNPQASPREAPFHALQALDRTAYFEIPLPGKASGPLQIWVEEGTSAEHPEAPPIHKVLLGLRFTALGETRVGLLQAAGSLSVKIWAEHPDPLRGGEEALKAELEALGDRVTLRIATLPHGSPTPRSLAVGPGYQGLA